MWKIKLLSSATKLGILLNNNRYLKQTLFSLKHCKFHFPHGQEPHAGILWKMRNIVGNTWVLAPG